ncbi:MAG: protein kinase domain-containing protein, partial [Pseudonocardiaceae bacterium]
MPTRVFTKRYQIVRKVARGGMAEVYLAKDLLLERPVALKVLFPEFSNDPSFVERFRREARAAANLNHANIVSIFDWGEEDGTYFIVMEYVDGDTLRELINTKGPLSAVRAAEIGADVAGALHFAHLSGVVHRDVKPGNVLLSGGRVKVTDFGIARNGDPAESLTQTGAVMGTATYFSPEQAQGHTVDPRSDVYSLGVVLYEMVAKRPPFTGESPLSIAYQHVREEPSPPSAYNPNIPASFDELILRAMAKHPDDRPASADELRDELLDFTEGRVSQSRSQPVLVATSLGDQTTFAPPVDSGLDGTRIASRGPVPSGVRRPPPKNRTGAYLAVLAILLSLLAALLFLLSRELGGGDSAAGQVSVPSAIDKDVAEARRLIEAAGLE